MPVTRAISRWPAHGDATPPRGACQANDSGQVPRAWHQPPRHLIDGQPLGVFGWFHGGLRLVSGPGPFGINLDYQRACSVRPLDVEPLAPFPGEAD